MSFPPHKEINLTAKKYRSCLFLVTSTNYDCSNNVEPSTPSEDGFRQIILKYPTAGMKKYLIPRLHLCLTLRIWIHVSQLVTHPCFSVTDFVNTRKGSKTTLAVNIGVKTNKIPNTKYDKLVKFSLVFASN